MKANKQIINRRSFIEKTVTLAAGLTLTREKLWGSPAYIQNLLKHNSNINGVQIGLITYSFRAMKDQSAEATLQYILDSGVNAIELMGSVAESFVGKPENKMNRRIYSRLMRKEKKNDLSRNEKKELADLHLQKTSFDKELDSWNKNRNAEDFVKLRNMYNDAGVEIYGFKPDYLLRKGNSDENISYAMQAGRALGASHVTIELPEDPTHSLKLGNLAQ